MTRKWFILRTAVVLAAFVCLWVAWQFTSVETWICLKCGKLQARRYLPAVRVAVYRKERHSAFSEIIEPLHPGRRCEHAWCRYLHHREGRALYNRLTGRWERVPHARLSMDMHYAAPDFERVAAADPELARAMAAQYVTSWMDMNSVETAIDDFQRVQYVLLRYFYDVVFPPSPEELREIRESFGLPPAPGVDQSPGGTTQR